ncbi:MAG: manganese efflux pump [Pseudonocardiales bacterium]|nr:manganese efflux pump [Pseudonocardiales bacterium]
MDSVFFSFLLFVLPLGVDTFAIAAAVGASRPTGSTRWRISAVFVLCEGGMPLIGLALGASIGHLVGNVADYLSGGLLVLLGGYLWWADHDDEDDVAKTRRLTTAQGLALIGLALTISFDELAIGVGFGLSADRSVPAATVAGIAIQTVIVSQLGLSFGSRVSERVRECIERSAGPMLIVLGGYLLADALIHLGLITARHAVAVGLLILVLGAVTTGAHRVWSARVQAALSTPVDRVSALPQAGGRTSQIGVVAGEARPVPAAVAPAPAASRKSEANHLVDNRHGL